MALDRDKTTDSGKLRIGDHWNAITIIALSQTNPLKAVAEFIENSIDARAQNITITRGKERGQPYLKVVDDGEGIPKDENGIPNFKHVATHICDSIKRRLKEQGAKGLQGEFGIGLLSFWTVGEELTLKSAAADGTTYQMRMAKGDPDYTIIPRRLLFHEKGTELKVQPLLPGLRQFSGEKIQWYLASELRDRIRNSGVKVRIVDRQARAEYVVEPRQFSGQLLHRLPAAACPLGEIYLELYLAEADPNNQVGLYRSGTRVLERITQLEFFQRSPWNSVCLQGIVDAPFLQLTPGTREGVILDAAYASFCEALTEVEETLRRLLEEQQKAEEEKASQQILKSIQKAFREALLSLPEEYDWFSVRGDAGGKGKAGVEPGAPMEGTGQGKGSETSSSQKQFFEFPGPLYSVRILPASCAVSVHGTKTFRAVARDKRRQLVEEGVAYQWEILEGQGQIDPLDQEIATFTASAEPGLCKVRVTALQGEIACSAESLVTMTDSLLPEKPGGSGQRGLPSYTYQHAPGALWRARYQAETNLIVINSGHRDFLYASRQQALKLRYLCRLFAKELVHRNFPGAKPEDLLERMIELCLYTEEHLH